MPHNGKNAVEVENSFSNQSVIEDKPASQPTTPRKVLQTPSHAAISPDIVKINPFLYGREDKKPKRFVALTEGFSPNTEDKFKARLKRRYSDDICREPAAVKYTPSKGTAVAISPAGTHYRKRSCYGDAQLNVSICVAAPIPPILLDQPPTPKQAPAANNASSERQHAFVMSSTRVAAQKRRGKRLKKNKAVMGGKTANEIACAAGLRGRHEFTHAKPRCVAGADGQVPENLTVETKAANTRELVIEKLAMELNAKVDLRITGIQHGCISTQREYKLTSKVDGLIEAVQQSFIVDTRDVAAPTHFDTPVLQVFQNTRLNALKRREKANQDKENSPPNVMQTFFKSPPKSPSVRRAVRVLAVSERSDPVPPSSTSFKETFFRSTSPTTFSEMLIPSTRGPQVTIATILNVEIKVADLVTLDV